MVTLYSRSTRALTFQSFLITWRTNMGPTMISTTKYIQFQNPTESWTRYAILDHPSKVMICKIASVKRDLVTSKET
jgi:hypothetical protein